MGSEMRHNLQRYVLAIACAVLMGLGHATSAAAPRGADLLKACRHSLEQGFDSLEGSLCTWYVTPCDCGTGHAAPRVCLPPDPQVTDLAGLVVSGLLEDPALQNRPAGEAAAAVLATVYPCPSEAPK